MWRLIGISLIVVGVIIGMSIVTIQHYKKPLFTPSYFLKPSREITLPRTHNPYTVAIGSHLFTISSHPNYINVESSDWTYKSCQIAYRAEDKIKGKIEAAVLGEKILVWGFEEINYEDFERDASRANYTLLMLDPWRCNYTVLAHFERVVPKIVVNEKSVDVLCPSQAENCLPCRFNERGEMSELKRQVSLNTWDTAFLEAFNQDHNYVYAANDERGTSLMKVLDQEFNILKQANFNFSIEKLAVSSRPTKSQIGVLYEQPERQFHIAVFDANLQPVFTYKLREPDEYEPFTFYLTMDSRGNSFVTSVLVNKTEKYHLARYDADGHLVGEIDVDEYWRNEPLATQTFLIEESEYCLVNHYRAYEVGSFGCTYVKCINVT